MLLPGCDAVMTQVPGDTKLSVVPLTPQMEDVLEANCTASPEVAEAESAAGVLPKVWAPGVLKLMVCAASATVKLWLTEGAAE